jgi:hypothetical protein
VSSPQNSQQAPRLHLGTKTHSKHHQNINLPQLQSNLVDQSHQQFRLNSPSNNPAAINIRYHVQNGLNQQPQSTKNSTVDTSTAGVLEKQRMSKNKQKIVQKLNSYADVHDENVSLQPQAVAEDVFRSYERVAVPPVLTTKRFTQASVAGNEQLMTARNNQHRNESTVPTSNASFELANAHAMTSRVNNPIINKKDSIFNNIENPM